MSGFPCVIDGGDRLRIGLSWANAGRLMTRDEILDHLWGVDFVAESNVVDRHVRNLRAKLQND
jgi:DNA-binding response OmpR family regulator